MTRSRPGSVQPLLLRGSEFAHSRTLHTKVPPPRAAPRSVYCVKYGIASSAHLLMARAKPHLNIRRQDIYEGAWTIYKTITKIAYSRNGGTLKIEPFLCYIATFQSSAGFYGLFFLQMLKVEQKINIKSITNGFNSPNHHDYNIIASH
jgi:hypothetical protein